VLRLFVGVWLVYWLAVMLLPVSAIYPATLEALLVQASFVALVVVSHASVTRLFGAGRAPAIEAGAIASAPRVVWWALAISLIGLQSLAYDKIFIQGIDYSEGVAFAREEWRRLGEEREGEASSAFSAIGYLLGSAYYVALVLVLTQPTTLSDRQRGAALLMVFALVLGNSALTGGRSSILLLVAVAASALTARRDIRLRMVLSSARLRMLLRLALLGGLGYVVYVFYERAASSDTRAIEYAFDFMPFLGLEVAAWYRDSLGDSAVGALSAMLVLTLSYITHSFASVAAIIDAPPEDAVILFRHALNILRKLGIGSETPGEWFLIGRFPSLPGGLWHQFGPLGFVLGSMTIGAVAGATVAWACRRPGSVAALGAFTLAGATLLLSPAVFALDFLSAPFVGAAFLLLAWIPAHKSLRRHRRWPRFSLRLRGSGPRANGSTVYARGPSQMIDG
jgi:hypothetical protein